MAISHGVFSSIFIFPLSTGLSLSYVTSVWCVLLMCVVLAALENLCLLQGTTFVHFSLFCNINWEMHYDPLSSKRDQYQDLEGRGQREGSLAVKSTFVSHCLLWAAQNCLLF